MLAPFGPFSRRAPEPRRVPVYTAREVTVRAASQNYLVDDVCAPLRRMFSFAESEHPLRVLIANTPLMYRQTLALAIHRHAPDSEVMIADPASLDGNAERFSPHVLIRDDDGIEVGSPEGVVCWVGVIIDDHLKARISLDGKVSEVHEVSLYELLAALDEATRLVSA